MWSGALAGPEHCPYCQRTAVAHAGKTLGTFKGYLFWEKVDIPFHNYPAAQRYTQNALSDDGLITKYDFVLSCVSY